MTTRPLKPLRHKKPVLIPGQNFTEGWWMEAVAEGRRALEHLQAPRFKTRRQRTASKARWAKVKWANRMRWLEQGPDDLLF